MSDDLTLSSCYTQAERHRKSLDTHLSSSTSAFQETVLSAITSYEQCLQIAARVSLFSPNESLDDVSSTDLQYFLLHAHIGELRLRVTAGERKDVLLSARESLEAFLNLLDKYDILSRADRRILERYTENRDGFEVAAVAGADAAKRRQVKIEKFKEERALRSRIEFLEQRGRSDIEVQDGDEIHREVGLKRIELAKTQAWASLEGIALELKMLAMAPAPESVAPTTNGSAADERTRTRDTNDYSERLGPSLESLMQDSKTGPLLSSTGRPIRPFTLLDSRQRLQNGVFRPDHSLPTMSIDEYLEEEKRRGGIIEGGGEPPARVVNEDDFVAADRETEEARRWDDFKDENPRGSGNTMNMG